MHDKKQLGISNSIDDRWWQMYYDGTVVSCGVVAWKESLRRDACEKATVSIACQTGVLDVFTTWRCSKGSKAVKVFLNRLFSCTLVR
jgi:hypothetical protein